MDTNSITFTQKLSNLYSIKNTAPGMEIILAMTIGMGLFITAMIKSF